MNIMNLHSESTEHICKDCRDKFAGILPRLVFVRCPSCLMKRIINATPTGYILYRLDLKMIDVNSVEASLPIFIERFDYDKNKFNRLLVAVNL